MNNDFDDETIPEDGPCPKCGEHKVMSRYCDAFNCDYGYCDEYEDDPINFAPGEEYVLCRECFGTGVMRWCSGCGCNISFYEYRLRNVKP